MSEFVMTGSDMFGRYCLIEQKRYGAPNEKHVYKVISTFRSNCWCEVPYKAASGEVLHDQIEDCVSVIHCGICEINVQRFRLADIELLPKKSSDRDRLLEIADEMDRVRSRCEFCNKESGCDWADETMCLERYIDDYARRIREALGADDG